MTAFPGEDVTLTAARGRVSQWRRLLLLAASLRAALLASGAGLLVAAALRIVGGSPSGVAAWALVAAVGTAAWSWMRSAVVRLSAQRTALWLEEHTPALRYALVTTVDEAPPPLSAGYLERAVRAADWEAPAWRAVRRALLWPIIIAAVGAVAFALTPASPAHTGVDRRTGLGAGAASSHAAPLGAVLVTIRPPGYTALPAVRLESPAMVRAYPGSVVTVQGRGAASSTRVTRDARSIATSGNDDRWSAEFRSDSARSLLRIERTGGDARLIALEPLIDSAPTVTLRLPARDTVLRVSTGSIALAADLHDDLALASARFEYIVSSGEGERFTFKSGTLGTLPLGVGRDAPLRSSLSLESLALAPGDVVHVRAVAVDRNSVSGPGVGTSESRTIRVARLGEYDSVAVEQAPPPDADKSVISQRMLIMLTEALLKRAPRLPRPDLVAESRRIGRDQARLRRQVSDIIFARLGGEPDGEHFHGDGHGHADTEQLGSAPLTPEQLLQAAERATQGAGNAIDFEHDETPVLAINRPMLEAYNAMWDAGRALDGGEPRRAIKPMYAALAAIQRARAAERLYLRGAPPRVVVDLARVRLAGKGTGDPSPRTPRAASAGSRRPQLQRFARALALLPNDGAAAVDSLIILRLAVADARPAAASALEAAIAELRSARDATASLLRARRALDDAMVTGDSIPPWGGVR
ncbi:MAG: hypothetical protein IT359_16550 [Gemmatimonadaceae bacterium]|nr:hypothetical protein [Gemmatimonadaceae bacterium]